MVEENINSITELYKKVLPALKSKKKELTRNKLSFISENMIWNCLRESKWSSGDVKNLTLHDIVSDIFCLTEKELITYLSEIDKRKRR